MTDDPRKRALQTWNIPHWSEGYVDIAADGELLIHPRGRGDERSVGLAALLEQLRAQGQRLPVLIRFSDILHDRVNRLCGAFNDQITRQGYGGHYTAVYPIKVNQQRRVVEEILAAEPAAGNGQIGLEAGSKPELLAVLALSEKPDSVIVCNGYKDREYIRLALLGRRLGHRVYIVVEKQSELRLILEEAQALGVTPLIGVRARLASIGHGNWQNTGGEKSKFGLSAAQILAMVQHLREARALDSLQMLHFHLGSQIANIQDIQTGLRECARFYRELRQSGAPVDTIDIGGGLGVDYEGTRSRSACSMNYSVDEYARNVVQTFHDACAESSLPHPNLISESGRALTAHHAVLVTNIIDREVPDDTVPASISDQATGPLRTLWENHQLLSNGTNQRSDVEIHHDAAHAMNELQTQFAHGLVSLEERAQAEQLHTAIGRQLQQRLQPANRVHRAILDELNEKLAEKLFLNFSVFQSLPDVWGIDQIFPILPLQGLLQPATRRAIVQDMTCDSDGRIDRYVDGQGIESTLPLPEGEDQGLLAFFMTGAYQEILGDMHNLFGDTDAVDVTLDSEGRPQARNATSGDTLADVLTHVNFDPTVLQERLAGQVERTPLTEAERARLLEAVEAGLAGYTYLADSDT